MKQELTQINQGPDDLFTARCELGKHVYGDIASISDHESAYMNGEYIGSIHWDPEYFNPKTQLHNPPTDACQWYSTHPNYKTKTPIRGYENILNYLRAKAREL